MDDSTAIEGVWQITQAELAGEEMPALLARKTEVELVAGAYTVSFSGEIADRGTYTLAVAGGHKAITLTGTEGTNAGRTIPAIYQLTGNRLRICYGLDGAAPGAFATKAGAAHFLATYRRLAAPA